jgi:hypothetical protein
LAKRSDDPGPNLSPIQASISTTERRNGDRMNAKTPYLIDERLESGLYVLHSGPATPMPLGGKVDDEARIGNESGRIYEHSTWLDLSPPCCARVRFEVARERLLELQRDPFAHETDSVDRVDQGFGICLEEVTATLLDHGFISLTQG